MAPATMIKKPAHDHRVPARNERGLSITPFVAVIFAALIMTAGLVIDGGQKVAAASRAETAAAGASRAAGNAAATQELGAGDPAGAAVAAARNYLAGQPGVTGSVTVSAGIVEVNTQATEPTILLSAIGIDAVTGTGRAQASIVPTGESR
ncbi:MAG TPA: pilus assembly protein TadG-related protein [Propionibacteriaceae bacterium]|nr:pilus assembly protein TadG-related protein [Propionibacteriaceae bacterium]